MTTAPELLTVLFGHLNENCEYAVLRNFEGLPEKNNSRDIDIIIERKVFKKHKSALIALLEKHNWKVDFVITHSPFIFPNSNIE